MTGYLPEEVLEQILHCLPPKAIVKCTLVCKSWMSMIKSSDFIHSHLRRTVQTSHLRLLRSVDVEQNHRDFFSLHWESPECSEYTKLESPFRFITNDEYGLDDANYWPILKEKTTPRIDVVGTCNGLICLADFLCLIWNPSIRKYVVLPRTTATQKKDLTKVIKSFGFGYDPRNKNYKLSDSLEHRHVSVNDAVHWLVLRREKNKDNAIVCFDLEGETFAEMVAADALRRELCYISKYREWLALMIRCKLIGQEPTSSGFFMWVMNEYGIAESWTIYVVQCTSARIYIRPA
ncbi:F-box/kelch-repeat protein At3g23880-like [Rosa rugosa]|uniref:F-box/kelch-repeat protein At3g23880-like n=1 Tax=Rosa rugosa TaxID=74645 RepID=UPI002B4018ED|nr:F-box/kelch-repeat protein At3g23880-like [Rosa rugosa]